MTDAGAAQPIGASAQPGNGPAQPGEAGGKPAQPGGAGGADQVPGVAGSGPPNPIQAPGTSEATWNARPGLLRFPVLDVTAWTSAVIVAAHPDDEVLGAGGIVSMLATAGRRLRLIAVTDGEASHPGQDDAAQLTRRRAGERTEALLALGASEAEVLRLGLPDSGLAGRERDIAAALRDLVPGFDACLAPWEGDVHADHEAVGRAARQATEPAQADRRVTASGRAPASGRGQASGDGGLAFFYPVWTWHWARPADPRVPWRQAVRIPLAPAVAERKQAAIRCFGSQLEPRPHGAGPVLPDDFVSHFTRDYEVLFPVVSP